MHLQMANATSVTASTMPVAPSYRILQSPYDQPARPSIEQLVFQVQPTGTSKYSNEIYYSGDADVGDLTISAPRTGPTPFALSKRQVVVEIELITVVYLVPKVQVNQPKPNAVAVTVTVPPPTSTNTYGQWPIINPGSAGACWSDMACNSVCPNFQQNGWYAHCIDQACTQCRCQVISQNMCYGQAWSNATWVSGAPAKTIQINPAIATVTVVAAQAGPSLLDHITRRTRWKIISIFLLLLTSFLAF